MKIERTLIMFRYIDINAKCPREGYMDKNVYGDIYRRTFIDFAPIYDSQKKLNEEEMKKYLEKAFIYNQLNVKALLQIELIPGTEIEVDTEYALP